jgi:hypothetical protein
MTGFCRVGVMLKIYKYQNHSKCPRCEEDKETTAHVLQCQHPLAINLWTQSIQDLEAWMTINNGHPEMIELMILGLQQWHDNEHILHSYNIHEPMLSTAWKKQCRLGWRSFLQGFGLLNGGNVKNNTFFSTILKNQTHYGSQEFNDIYG